MMIEENDVNFVNPEEDIKEDSSSYDIYEYIGKEYKSEDFDKFKNFGDMAKAHKTLCKRYADLTKSFSGKLDKLGEDQLKTLASEFSSKIYGVPEKPEGYNLETRLEIDDEVTKSSYESTLKELSHMLSLSPEKAEEFRDAFEGYAMGLQDQIAQQKEDIITNDLKLSREVFGNDLSQVISVIDNFMDNALPHTRLGKDGANQLKLAMYNSGLAASPYMLAFLYDYASMFKQHPMHTSHGVSTSKMMGPRTNTERNSVMDRSGGAY